MKVFRSDFKSVLSSNYQSKVICSLIADEPKIVQTMAKEWMKERLHNVPWKRFNDACIELGDVLKKHRTHGYSLNISNVVSWFCKYLALRRQPHKFSLKEKKLLEKYIKSKTCKNYFAERVVNKPLRSNMRNFKLKDSVFAHLDDMVSNVTFDDYYIENPKLTNKLLGEPKDKEIFEKVENLLQSVNIRKS